jgi:hypothetical protein
VSVTLVIPAPPDFGVAASPTSRSVNAGANAGYTVTVSALNGFTGPVTLGLTGLPGMVGSATSTPATVSTAGTAQLAIATLTSAPGGSYPLTVTATSGSTIHTVAVTLRVTARDFAISASPTGISVLRGQSGTYSVSVSSLGGFTGSVGLSVTGLPTGASATFTPNPVAAPGTSTLTVQTTGSTPRSTFSLRITGTSGSLSHQITVTLSVR